ncbi:hypothetical protein GC167_08460 [bacterium]|nr:hypothetical protein [bacterium]
MHTALWSDTLPEDTPRSLTERWMKRLPDSRSYSLVVQSLGASLVSEFCALRPPQKLVVLSAPIQYEELPLWARWPGVKQLIALLPAPRLHAFLRLCLKRWGKLVGLPSTLSEFEHLSSVLYKALIMNYYSPLSPELGAGAYAVELHRIFDPSDPLSGIPKSGILHELRSAGHLVERESPKCVRDIFYSIFNNDNTLQ